MTEERIPKIIHYCWFGGKEMPTQIKECMETWQLLNRGGYQIIKWDESNCSFDENDFIKNAYKDKKWAFVSDFYRMKALYEYGGIYLDTDVVVKHVFDPLLNDKFFCGFIYNCALGTAVIGAEKNNFIIKEMLDMYNTGNYIARDDIGNFYYRQISKDNIYSIPNIDYLTTLLEKYIPGFYLNNKEQTFNNIHILPKEQFEIGKLVGKYYTRHLCINSWIEEKPDEDIAHRIKHFLENNEKFRILFRIIDAYKVNKKHRCRNQQY